MRWKVGVCGSSIWLTFWLPSVTVGQVALGGPHPSHLILRDASFAEQQIPKTGFSHLQLMLFQTDMKISYKTVLWSETVTSRCSLPCSTELITPIFPDCVALVKSLSISELHFHHPSLGGVTTIWSCKEARYYVSEVWHVAQPSRCSLPLWVIGELRAQCPEKPLGFSGELMLSWLDSPRRPSIQLIAFPAPRLVEMNHFRPWPEWCFMQTQHPALLPCRALPSGPFVHQQSSWCSWNPEPGLPGGCTASRAPAGPPPPSSTLSDLPASSLKLGSSAPAMELWPRWKLSKLLGTAFSEREGRKVCEMR